MEFSGLCGWDVPLLPWFAEEKCGVQREVYTEPVQWRAWPASVRVLVRMQAEDDCWARSTMPRST